MTDPLDQLPVLLAETPGLDDAAFERLAHDLRLQIVEATVDKAGTSRPRRRARSPGSRRSLLRRAAAVAFVAIVVAGGIVLANSSSGPSTRNNNLITYVTAYKQLSNGDSLAFLIPFDLATSRLGAPIQVPGQVAVAPGGKLAVVINSKDDLGYLLDLGNGQLGRPINVGPKPVSVAFTPDGTTAYIADAGQDACGLPCTGPGNVPSDMVVPLDLRTGRLGSPVHACKGPMELAMQPSGRTLLVACFFNGVVAISTATNRVVAHYAVPGSPGNIAFTDGGNTAVIGQIHVVDLQGVEPWITTVNLRTGRVGKTIVVGRGGGTSVAALTPAGIAYINGWGRPEPSPPGYTSEILSLDLRTRRVAGAVKVPGIGQYAAAVGYWQGFGVRYFTLPDQKGNIYEYDPSTGRRQILATGSPNVTGPSTGPCSDIMALDPQTPLAIVEAFPDCDSQVSTTSFLRLVDLATGKIGPTVRLPKPLLPSSVEFAGGPSLNADTPSWPVGS